MCIASLQRATDVSRRKKDVPTAASADHHGHDPDEDTRLLQRIVQATGESDDVHGALDAALNQICAATGWIYGEAWLPDGDPPVLRRSPAQHVSAGAEAFAAASAASVFRANEGLPGRVWISGKTEWVPDFSTDPFFPRRETAEAGGLNAALGVPVIADGEVVAIFAFHMRSANEADERRVKLVTAVAAQFGPMIRRRRASDDLARQLSVTSGVLQGASDAIYVKDARGRYTMINPAGARLIGKTIDEIIGRTDTEIFPSPVGEKIRERDQEVMRTGQTVTYEQSLATSPDGIISQTTKSPYRDTIGVIIGVIGVSRDITELRRLEREGAERERLRESEARYRALAEAIPHMVWTNGPDGSVEYVNQRWVDFTGMSFEETQNGGWGKAIHPDDAPGTFARWAQASAARTPFEVEYRIKHGSDGVYRWHLARNLPVLDDAGNVVKWFGTATDINDQKRAEHAIRRSQEELELAVRERTRELQRSNAELEQFAYVASHDLQEPLRMVASYTQLLADRYRGRLDADADEFIAYAIDGAKRMQELISDLLTYSRVGSGSDERATVECDQVLRQALENLHLAIAESGGVVTSDPLPTIWADRVQLGQVFQNLIGNAIKFRGEEPPRVHISATDAGVAWRFSVRDNGIGIDPRYADRIFVLFQRLHAREMFPGTGIGLSLCKKIVERHGGELWMDSVPGKGSTFLFTIPKRRER